MTEAIVTDEATQTAKANKKTAKAKAKASAKPAKEAAPLATVKASALSTDVGPAVIAALSASVAREDKIKQEVHDLATKRYDMLAKLTNGIVKAAKNDDSIDLNAIFTPGAEKRKLEQQVGLALGYLEVVEPPKGSKSKAKIGTAKSVAKYFPSGRDQKDSVEYRRKQTFRQNFTHQVTKCIQSAAAIISEKMNAEIDKSGTLKLTGPAVEKHFGAPSVLLNEKQTVQNGNTAIQLKEKPSFTAIGRIAAEKAGKVLTVRKDSRSTVAEPDTAENAFVSLCDSLVKATNTLYNGSGLSEKQLAALRQVKSVVDTVLA